MTLGYLRQILLFEANILIADFFLRQRFEFEDS